MIRLLFHGANERVKYCSNAHNGTVTYLWIRGSNLPFISPWPLESPFSAFSHSLGRSATSAPPANGRSPGVQRSFASEHTRQRRRRSICHGFRRLMTAVRREETSRCAAWRPRAAVGEHHLDGTVRLLRPHCCRPRKALRFRGVRKASSPHRNDFPSLA